MKALVLLLGVLLAAPSAAGAAGHGQSFSGKCQFSGPIEPNPPITAVPKPGAHFSYQGTGACSGTFDGVSSGAAPTTVTFTNVATAFDTCELGPDFNLPGTMLIRNDAVTAEFAIKINLARLALAGPFALTTPGGGDALGVAQFAPADAAQAPQQCAGAGIATATLSASFTTVSPLVGTLAPSPSARSLRMSVRWRAVRHRARRRALRFHA
jgi:hypothetical protein